MVDDNSPEFNTQFVKRCSANSVELDRCKRSPKRTNMSVVVDGEFVFAGRSVDNAIDHEFGLERFLRKMVSCGFLCSCRF